MFFSHRQFSKVDFLRLNQLFLVFLLFFSVALYGFIFNQDCLPGGTQSAAAADIDRWQGFIKAGEEAASKKHWSKAEHQFQRAVREADRSEVGDQNLALSLRKLAEANIASHRYREAESNLQRAIKVGKDCGAEDPEAIRDLLELAKTYRSVNLEQFGKNVATVLRETGLDRIEILNTKDGNSRVLIRFSEKLNKHINSADVNEINVDKKLTFDIHEDKDGTITLTNIKGLKVKSKMWARLTQSSIDPNGDQGRPTALVTAEKLGLSKTVTTILPKPVYDRILSVVERIKHPELHSPWHKQLQEKISAESKTRSAVPTPGKSSSDAEKNTTSATSTASNASAASITNANDTSTMSSASSKNLTKSTNSINSTSSTENTDDSKSPRQELALPSPPVAHE
jgi:tetratricopeptide (TPR) repeat protein